MPDDEPRTPQTVTLVEVAPRDGLQNDPADLTTEQKVELITRAVLAGATRIEVTSFVSPKAVPKMADAEAVVDAVRNRSTRHQAALIGLVVNQRGVERARAAGIDEINAVVLTTDTFSRRNQGESTDESLRRLCDIVAAGKETGLRVSVTIGASFGCPFEGEVTPDRLIEVTRAVTATGPDEVALADTIGVAVPADVHRLVRALKACIPALPPLRLHLHNTRNMGIANAAAGISEGVTTIDASLGGIGGCPFAPAATGNIATEDLAYMLHRSGVRHGLDLDAVVSNVGWLTDTLGHPVPGMLAKSWPVPVSM